MRRFRDAHLREQGLRELHRGLRRDDGDGFDLPAGATQLAWSAVYPNQPYRCRYDVLEPRSHFDAEAEAIESWDPGHAHELELQEHGQRYRPTAARPSPAGLGEVAGVADSRHRSGMSR